MRVRYLVFYDDCEFEWVALAGPGPPTGGPCQPRGGPVLILAPARKKNGVRQGNFACCCALKIRHFREKQSCDLRLYGMILSGFVFAAESVVQVYLPSGPDERVQFHRSRPEFQMITELNLRVRFMKVVTLWSFWVCEGMAVAIPWH